MELPVVVGEAVGVAVAVRFDQSRATRSNIALACFRCSPRNFGGARSRLGSELRSWLAKAVGVAVAVRLTRAVRLARISGSTLVAVPEASSVSVDNGTSVEVAASRYELRSLCA